MGELSEGKNIGSKSKGKAGEKKVSFITRIPHTRKQAGENLGSPLMDLGKRKK